LAADQLVARRPSIVTFNMTRVPCKRVWVHAVHLSAMVLTATFLSLQESGQLSFHIHKESRRMIPGGVTTSLTLYVEVLDPTVRPGLPGALLSAAIKSPDGRIGTAEGSSLRLFGTNEAQVLDLSVEHPYVKNAVRGELAQVGAYTQSGKAIRPDCARIALLEGACADAVRWWKQQADAPRLYAPLLPSAGWRPLRCVAVAGSDSQGLLFASSGRTMHLVSRAGTGFRLPAEDGRRRRRPPAGPALKW